MGNDIIKFTTIRMSRESILQVKIAIPGTGYTLGEFYAIAAAEKIERDNLRTWIETPVKLSKPPGLLQATNVVDDGDVFLPGCFEKSIDNNKPDSE